MAGRGLIDDIELKYEAHWVSKFEPTRIVSQVRSLGGQIVEQYLSGLSSPDEIHIFRLSWINQSQLDDLKSLVISGDVFTIQEVAGGDSIQVRFAESDPLTYETVVDVDGDFSFAHEDVEGLTLDKYNAELHVVKVVQ